MKVLCIDGGGIRGLIPALVLAEIERRTGRRIAEMVDLVAGTSTGGVLACGLTRPGTDGEPAHTAELARLREEVDQLTAQVLRLQEEQSFTMRLLAEGGGAREAPALEAGEPDSTTHLEKP